MKIVVISEAEWVDQIAEIVRQSGGQVVPFTEREGYVPRLAAEYAAMIIVDGQQPDWPFWVTAPKASPATRRIPVIFVSEQGADRDLALESGADRALTPDQLRADLPDLLASLARTTSDEVSTRIQRQCADPLPAEAVEAIRLFNAGEYYRQHDLFEALWMEEEGPVRDLYRAVLQVGVAYYQIQRGNRRGAMKMLLRSLQWLAIMPDVCQGIDLKQLREDSGRVWSALEALPDDDDDLSTFDQTLLRPVHTVDL